MVDHESELLKPLTATQRRAFMAALHALWPGPEA
jgi:hypothetical protein